MQALLRVLFHFIGGFASGSFYVPYRKVRGWAWRTFATIVSGIAVIILSVTIVGYGNSPYKPLNSIENAFTTKSPQEEGFCYSPALGLRDASTVS